MAPSMNDLWSGAASLSDPTSLNPAPADSPDPSMNGPALGTYDDDELLDLWEKIRREALADRYIFERQWQHHLLYILDRQWIEYYSRDGGWKDKRMAPWIPRPVTNKCKETVQAIRSMFAAIKLGVNVRPNGSDPKDVSAAASADALAPVLHEVHNMDTVLNECDFWLCVTGNAFLHTFVDYNMNHGMIQDPLEQCQGCGAEYKSSEIATGGGVCPDCGANQFAPALDDEGQPITNAQPIGRPTTIALSPLELAFPNDYARFEDLPYVVRLRWRTKTFYENHPILKALVPKIAWQKSPNDLSLQLFRSLSRQNDMGIGPSWTTVSGSGDSTEEGITEYEVWYKPCDAYPDGLVFRVCGEQGSQIIHLEDTEALPGPLPYKTYDGKPVFTFAHAGYEHVGGRVLASGPLDVISQKQDQLNQLDSMILLIIQRMANPVWIYPKGAGITAMTGVPGLCIEWDSLVVGGNAKPERIAGEGPANSLFQIREQYLKDIEELAGTFDIIKGAQPAGVEAFSALQLLVERSQARFATVFTARGNMYKSWFQFAIELEREFGPDERTKSILSPTRGWTFQSFKRSTLMGGMSAIVEDGSNVPKTSLGMRASLDHAAQLGVVNLQDPDQQYEALKLMGLTKMVPTLDVHMQAALQKQQAFEDWVVNPANLQMALVKTQQQVAQYQQTINAMPPPMGAPVPPAPSALNNTPLKWKPWYNPVIHRQEMVKWLNSDRMRDLLSKQPQLEPMLDQAMQEVEQAVSMQQMAAQAAAAPQQPMQGGGRAMMNSNAEAQGTTAPGVNPSTQAA